MKPKIVLLFVSVFLISISLFNSPNKHNISEIFTHLSTYTTNYYIPSGSCVPIDESTCFILLLLLLLLITVIFFGFVFA